MSTSVIIVIAVLIGMENFEDVIEVWVSHPLRFKALFFKKRNFQRIISISSFSASSLYLFRMVTSVTPATSATSRWVRLSPPRIEDI